MPSRNDGAAYENVRRVCRDRRVLALEVRGTVPLEAVIHDTVLREPG